MGQAKRGRPRKAGARNAKGRLIVSVDRGNVVVQARAARFMRFQGGRADQQLGDQIGRAWAAGLLDGHTCDAAILRDIGRLYASLYWHEYAALAPKTGQLERRDRSTGSNISGDRPGERFKVLDAIVRDAGRGATAALEDLVVNGWWLPDDDNPWVARLIATAIETRAGVPTITGRATIGDRTALAAACKALVAMVEGGRAASRM